MCQVNFFLSKCYSSPLHIQKRSEVFTVIHKHPDDPSLPPLTLCLTIVSFYPSILLTPGDFMFLEHIKHIPPWESGTAWVLCSSLRWPAHFSVLLVFVEMSPQSSLYMKFQSTIHHLLCLHFPESCPPHLLIHNKITSCLLGVCFSLLTPNFDEDIGSASLVISPRYILDSLVHSKCSI